MGLGVEISRRLRRTNPRADPLVCAAGLLGSAPFLFLALACARGSIVATYVSIQQVSRGWSRSRVEGWCTEGQNWGQSRLWSRNAWICISALAILSCVTLGK